MAWRLPRVNTRRVGQASVETGGENNDTITWAWKVANQQHCWKVFYPLLGFNKSGAIRLFYHLILICVNYKIHSQITLICQKSQVIYSQSGSIRRISLLKGSDWANGKDFEDCPRSPFPTSSAADTSSKHLNHPPPHHHSLPLIKNRDRSKETTYKWNLISDERCWVCHFTAFVSESKSRWALRASI